MPPPPQLSPDGNYVWDGTQWQPIAGAAPEAAAAHLGVFKAWNAIEVEPADPAAPVAEPQASAPAQMQSPPSYEPVVEALSPEPQIDYSYTVDDPNIVPLWRQHTGTGLNKYLYVGSGLVVVVIGIMVLNWFNAFEFLQFLGGGSSSTANQVTTPSPTPDWSGPESARADRFLNGALKPAIAGLDPTIAPLNLHCSIGLSTACFDAINAAKDQVKKVSSVIAGGDIPPCIEAPMTRMKADVKGMTEQLQAALKGFNDNNQNEVGAGLARFRSFLQAALSDYGAAGQLQKKCYTIVLPTWVPA